MARAYFSYNKSRTFPLFMLWLLVACQAVSKPFWFWNLELCKFKQQNKKGYISTTGSANGNSQGIETTTEYTETQHKNWTNRFRRKSLELFSHKSHRFFYKIQLYRSDSQEFYCLSILVLCVTKISVFWRANRFFTVKICILFILQGMWGKLGSVIRTDDFNRCCLTNFFPACGKLSYTFFL